jgi:uncharacterized protein YneF (UPF0154 family)
MEQKFGPTLGIVIVVLVFVVGGIYFLFTQELKRPPVELPPINEEAL